MRLHADVGSSVERLTKLGRPAAPWDGRPGRAGARAAGFRPTSPVKALRKLLSPHEATGLATRSCVSRNWPGKVSPHWANSGPRPGWILL